MSKQVLVICVVAVAVIMVGSFLRFRGRNAPSPAALNVASKPESQPVHVEQMAGAPKPDTNVALVQAGAEEASITISFHSPVSLLLTDPSGRRLGDDPSKRASYSEIPRAYYEAGGLEDDETGEAEEDPAKSMFIPAPAPGQYKLTVTGTAEGAYSADFALQRSDNSNSSVSLQNVPIGLNQNQTFTFTYAAADSSLHLAGGLHADDPDPDQVNHLLSFKTPKDSHVLLTADMPEFRVAISYSPDIVPGTFSAALGEENVSTLFHPRPGTSESVALPTKLGHRFLDVTVSGNLAGRVVRDTNRLVFDVVASSSAQ